MEVDQSEFTNRIWQFNESIALGLSTLSVYFYLLKISSECGRTTFTVSDSEMSRQLKMTRKTVKVCKEKLRRFGIISFLSKSGVPAELQLKLDYPIIYEKDNFSGDLLRETKAKKLNNKIIIESKIAETAIIESGDTAPLIIDKDLKSKHVPTLEEFLDYARSIETYDNNLISEIKDKYITWADNGWRNNFDRPITNWKSVLKNTMPYLKNNSGKNNKSFQTIPAIKRIKIDDDNRR